MVIFLSLTKCLFRHGFPVFVAGTCDINGSFYPTFLAVSSHEDTQCFVKFFEVILQQTGISPTYIMADASLSITNAATLVFPDTTRLMCWAHVAKNIDQRLKSLNATAKLRVRTQINLLQYAQTEAQFFNGIF